MKLNKLKFKKVKYGCVISMGEYSYISNDAMCATTGTPSYNYTGCYVK